MEEKLKELLDDYYGASSEYEHRKEEIIDFITGYSYEIGEIIMAEIS